MEGIAEGKLNITGSDEGLRRRHSDRRIVIGDNFLRVKEADKGKMLTVTSLTHFTTGMLILF